MDRLLFYLIVLSALGCGLNGGVFFAFSNFIMSGLARLPAEQGVNAMNSINITVVNPLFMVILFGTAATLFAASALALFRGHDARTPWLIAAAVLYFGGVVLVTMICNVPRNDALAAISSADPSLAAAWSEYVRSWTAWNHVRTSAGILAAACLSMAVWMSRATGGE